jgi:hypothetical protein
MQVSYWKSNSNEAALHELTGAGGDVTMTDLAFEGLHRARDQYGADLVSLVRKFQAPEHQSCGTAWLVGGDEQPIEPGHAAYGFSVVSDGTDRDETDGFYYGCVDETLAHELGHNMGQTHNIEDSQGGTGAHAYSYGYREATATGFHTVMAYPLPEAQQYMARHFASPAVILGSDRPTGTAAADNVRSLAQTMPIVATFRPAGTAAPRRRVGGDVDGDGKSDISWHNGGGELYQWLMDGAAIRGGLAQASAGTQFQGADAVADFNGDGRADALYSIDGWTRLVVSSYLGGYRTWESVGPRPTGLHWRFAGTGDLDGDGNDDLVWHDPRYGILQWHTLNGVGAVGTGSLDIDRSQAVRAIADFNGDGRADILLSDNNRLVLLQARAGGFDPLAVGAHPVGWLVAGAGDITGDGKAELFWHSGLTGDVYTWIMDGASVRDGRAGTRIAPGHAARAVGDYNGDGRSDLVFSDGEQLLVLLATDAGGFAASAVGAHPRGWTIVGNRMARVDRPAPGDIDGDGVSDIVLHDPASGTLTQWLMRASWFVEATRTANTGAGQDVVALADFSGDRRSDVLLSGGGELRMLVGGGDGFTAVPVGGHPAGWSVVGAGDLNLDNKADVVWHNPASGEIYYWLMDGAAVLTGRGGFHVPLGQTVRAVADFDGDGRTDLLFSNGAQLLMLLATSAGTFTQVAVGAHTAHWTIVGAGDAGGDGKADIAWFHPKSRAMYLWEMDGALVRTGRVMLDWLQSEYDPRALADYDGDGYADLLAASGTRAIVLTNNRYGSYSQAWVPPAIPTGAAVVVPD